MRFVRIAAAFVTGGLLLAACASGSTAPGPAAASASTCATPAAPRVSQVSPDGALTNRFATFGDTSGGWAGADSTYSVALPGGREAWLFSDTLWGKVSGGKVGRDTTEFLHNSLLLDDGSALRAVQRDPAHPDSLISNDGEDFHWVGGALANPDGTVSVATIKLHPTGQKLGQWAWLGNELAVVDPQTGQVHSVSPAPSATGIQWASWLQRDGDAIYVYGVEEKDRRKFAHVARVQGSLADAADWRFWDGSRWNPDERASARIADDVSNEFSVTPDDGRWLLITHDTSQPLSNRIVARVACAPQGGFGPATEVYRTPETGKLGTYARDDVWTYNAHAHPDLSRDGGLVISYNVNSLNPDAVYDDASVYRPRFIRVTFARA